LSKKGNEMKRLIGVLAILGGSLLAVSAQSNPGAVGNPPRDLLVTKGTGTGNRARIVGRNEPESARGDQRPADAVRQTEPEQDVATAMNHARSGLPDTPANPKAISKSTTPNNSAPVTAMSQEYRVGIGDVLDVQLAELPTRKSTLFTVRDGGALDYPLAGDPIVVAGLTAEEIAARLRTRIKVLENPKVVVKVRDYVSHNVIITGLVADPGAKFLRREATPLYVVLAEAQPRPDAISANIMRSGQPVITVDLSKHEAMSTLVMPGDVIKIMGPSRPATSFFYTGGAINSPGQKPFNAGLTLTQAILSSGGVTRDAGAKVKIARQGGDGRLATSEYNLRLIQDGKTADPVIQSGDRITVGENR